MARLDVEFIDESCGFVAANEDFFEQKILKRVKNGDYSGLSAREYEQLSPKRKAVLEWYPFKKNAKILELGAGLGALTELFAEKKCMVTCVEVKTQRAKIIKERLREKTNVKIICDNPVLYETDEKFDYIIVHDIWGYIKKYNKIENAYDVFLTKIKKNLTESGHLIIIADNRLALKYFSGNVDEYSRKLFVGLNQYKNYSFIKSFDKQELYELLFHNGLSPQNIYYVNSDYYFADKIYTDYSLQNIKYCGQKFSTSYNAFSFFDENKVYESLQHNGIIDRFVDAYIVDYSINQKQNGQLVYFQAGNRNMNGIGIFLEDGLLKKKELIKETGEFVNEEIIDKFEWSKIVETHSSIDEEFEKCLKHNVKLPFVDPVEILNFGREHGLRNILQEDDLQLIQEEKMIQRLVGELYEN